MSLISSTVAAERTYLWSHYWFRSTYDIGGLSVVNEIVNKLIGSPTYRLSIHLFYFWSERSWCETPISGAKDI